MGFTTPELPDVDPLAWTGLPRSTRIQLCSRHWAEHGFGTPYAAYLFYLVKVVMLYIGGAARSSR